MTIDAYPLTWPAGRPRTDRYRREKSNFETTFARSRDDIIHEVELLTGRKHNSYGSDPVILSSNIALRRDGLPLAGQKQPDDPGVAVYFTYQKQAMSFACDRWQKVEDNMRAISKTIDALRGVARWGTGDMLKAAFTGFAALPAPTGAAAWHVELGLNTRSPTPDELTAAYRRRRSEAHPDKGGSDAEAARVNLAYEQAKQELGYT